MESKFKIGQTVRVNSKYSHLEEYGREFKVLHIEDFFGDVGIHVYDPDCTWLAPDEYGSNGIFLEQELEATQ